MKAVLLVGGEGTRLRPLTTSLPKPLVPVANVPYLDQLLYFLEKLEIDEVILTACYLSAQIEAFCGRPRESGMKLTYVVEQSPLGTGGAVRNVASRLDGTFLVFNGDVLTDFDLVSLTAFHREKKAGMTLALVPVSDPSRFGVADLRPDGRIVKFVEKPPKGEAPSSFINAGIYVVEPETVDSIPGGIKFSIETGLFPRLAEEGRLYGLVSDAYWIDIGTPECYLQAHRDFLDGRVKLKPAASADGDWRRTKVFAAPGAVIEPGAEVGPYVVLGENGKVFAGARISGSVLLDGVAVEAGAVVTDSIVGSGCRVPRGTLLERKIALFPEEKSF